MSDNKAGSMAITVNWSSQPLTIHLSRTEWIRIISGEQLKISGSGRNSRGKKFRNYWNFGGGIDGFLIIRLDGGDIGFNGKLSDALIQKVK